jgi:probable phosphoglycerate mutase
MELILIRHGLPEKVINKDGAPADPHLSEEGREQAQIMAEWMSGANINRLYSSPMRRAVQTANPLAEKTNLEIEIRNGVAEYDRNADNYVPVEELKHINYERWLKLMQGEVDADFADFSAAVIEELESVVAENAGNRVAVACHGGVINVWTAHVIGFEPRLFFNPGYTSINRFMASSSGTKSVISLNEAAPARAKGIAQ